MKNKFRYVIVASLLFGASGFNSAKAITADELLVAVQQFAGQVVQAFTQVGQALGDHETRISDNDAGIAALGSALAANATLISSMQTQIDAIEAQNVGLDGGDLTGSIYCFINYGSELTGSSGGFPPGVYTSHSKGVLTFTSSTQLSFLDRGDVDAFLETNTGVIGTGSTTGGTSEIYSYSLTGNTVTIFGVGDNGENYMYYLTPDANLLAGDNAFLEDGGSNHSADLSIAVRADSC